MRHIPGRVPLAAVRIKSTIALVAFLQAVSPLGIAKVSPAADARHCLDLGDNREIARCAEQYRPGGPRRHARKADSASVAPRPRSCRRSSRGIARTLLMVTPRISGVAMIVCAITIASNENNQPRRPSGPLSDRNR